MLAGSNALFNGRPRSAATLLLLLLLRLRLPLLCLLRLLVVPPLLLLLLLPPQAEGSTDSPSVCWPFNVCISSSAAVISVHAPRASTMYSTNRLTRCRDDPACVLCMFRTAGVALLAPLAFFMLACCQLG